MEIRNKVAESGIITLNLSDYFPKGDWIGFDLKSYLWNGFVLREKEFRAAMDSLPLEEYRGKNVHIFCSEDAIIPTWAWMLVVKQLGGIAESLWFGSREDAIVAAYEKALAHFSAEEYAGQRVVVKGCSDFPVPVSAYMRLTEKLLPHVKSILFGEPCSTVPVFKRKS